MQSHLFSQSSIDSPSSLDALTPAPAQTQAPGPAPAPALSAIAVQADHQSPVNIHNLGVAPNQVRAATNHQQFTELTAQPQDTIFDLSLSSDLDQNNSTLFIMEPSWPQPFYNYYTPETRSMTDRQPATSPIIERNTETHTHRRVVTHPASSTFLPPPPPHSTSGQQGGMNLPPFSQAFYQSSYHPTGTQSTPTNVHSLPHGLAYSAHASMQGSAQSCQYPMTSPMSLSDQLSSSNHRAPPPHSYNESPRMPPFSSSPGLHHLSPTSSTAHMGPPGIIHSSASTSSSSFPSVSRTLVTLPKSGKRMSDSSNGSWDEGDSRYMPGSAEVDLKDLEDQPWGMPQDEYKALNPRDKKQVRNRIGARRFRAKRKDYVTTLESGLRARDDEIISLRKEINNLRAQLGLPAQSPPEQTGLGLVVSSGGNGTGRDGWGNAGLAKIADGDA